MESLWLVLYFKPEESPKRSPIAYNININMLFHIDSFVSQSEHCDSQHWMATLSQIICCCYFEQVTKNQQTTDEKRKKRRIKNDIEINGWDLYVCQLFIYLSEVGKFNMNETRCKVFITECIDVDNYVDIFKSYVMNATAIKKERKNVNKITSQRKEKQWICQLQCDGLDHRTVERKMKFLQREPFKLRIFC